MNLLKKIISLSLVIALSFQSLNAGIMEKALQNYTPASQLTLTDNSGNVIKTMYYTGGYYFRFNGVAAPEPLWNFSPPEIEAGCNGFNLKGMFMSLLGLDQFGAMLQNAGTSLAWGVAVGLIYSLPGINAVFKQINQWAKDIQKLLGNACQSGIAIGRAIGEKVGPGYSKEDITKSLFSDLDGGDIADKSQKRVQGLIDSMGLDTLDFNWDSGFTFSGTGEATQKSKEDAISGPVQNLFGDVSFGGAILNDYMLSPEGKDFYDEIVAVTQIKENEPIFYKTLLLNYDTKTSSSGQYDLVEDVETLSSKYSTAEEKQNFGLKLLAYAIFYNIAGDIGYSKANADTTINNIGKKFKCSGASSDTSSCSDDDKSSADSMVLNFLENPAHNLAQNGLVGNVGISDTLQLETLLLEGKSTSSSDTDKKVKPFYAPQFLIVATKEKKENKTNFMLVPSEAPNDKFFNSANFPGTIVISKCSLFETLKGKIDETMLQGLLEHNGEAITCEGIQTVMFGNIDIYADILGKSTKEKIADGIKKIQDVNTYMLTNAIFEQLQSILYTNKMKYPKLKSEATTDANKKEPSKGQPVLDPEGKSVMLELFKKYNKAVNDAQINLKKKYPNSEAGVQGLVDYFESLKKDIKERTAEKIK